MAEASLKSALFGEMVLAHLISFVLLPMSGIVGPYGTEDGHRDLHIGSIVANSEVPTIGFHRGSFGLSTWTK